MDIDTFLFLLIMAQLTFIPILGLLLYGIYRFDRDEKKRKTDESKRKMQLIFSRGRFQRP